MLARGSKVRLPKRGCARELQAGRSGTQEARPGAVTTLRWRAERRHAFARRCDLRPNDASLGAPSPRFIRGYGKGLRRTRRRKEYGRRSVAYLVQPEFTVDRLQLGRLDQLAMRDLHRVQRAFQLLLPELQKLLQLRKFREQVVSLPDVGLQQPTMI